MSDIPGEKTWHVAHLRLKLMCGSLFKGYKLEN